MTHPSQWTCSNPHDSWNCWPPPYNSASEFSSRAKCTKACHHQPIVLRKGCRVQMRGSRGSGKTGCISGSFRLLCRWPQQSLDRQISSFWGHESTPIHTPPRSCDSEILPIQQARTSKAQTGAFRSCECPAAGCGWEG